MPMLMDEHLQRLKQCNAEFEPYLPSLHSSEMVVHANGSLAIRNPQREYQRLLHYWEKQSADYSTFIEGLTSLIPPMHPHCRISVLLPARFEEQYLSRVLDLLATQYKRDWTPFPIERYEVLVFNNCYDDEPADDSAGVFQHWKHSHQDRAQHFHFFSYQYPLAEKYPLTLSRRILADVALLRALKRSSYLTSLYFAPEDADTIWMDPRQLAFAVHQLDAFPFLDALRGQQDRCPWMMCHNDLLTVLRRSWNFTEAFLARRSLWPDQNPMYNFTWNRLVTSGWNTAFTAEVYAQIQGYTHDRRMGEDVDIGERISCIRGYLSHGTFLPQVGTTGRLPTRSEGSPRRWLLRVARHVEPYERTNAYANFFSRSYEHLVRIRSTEELLEEAQAVAHISQKNIHFFEEVLTKDWRFTLDIRGNRVIALQQYYKVLECLGFRQRDIEIQGTEVRIHRFDALADHLAMYRIKNASNAPDLFPLQTKGRINWRSCTRSL